MNAYKVRTSFVETRVAIEAGKRRMFLLYFLNKNIYPSVARFSPTWTINREKRLDLGYSRPVGSKRILNELDVKRDPRNQPSLFHCSVTALIVHHHERKN